MQGTAMIAPPAGRLVTRLVAPKEGPSFQEHARQLRRLVLKSQEVSDLVLLGSGAVLSPPKRPAGTVRTIALSSAGPRCGNFSSKVWRCPPSSHDTRLRKHWRRHISENDHELTASH
jgi:hypothetical protein